MIALEDANLDFLFADGLVVNPLGFGDLFGSRRRRTVRASDLLGGKCCVGRRLHRRIGRNVSVGNFRL